MNHINMTLVALILRETFQTLEERKREKKGEKTQSHGFWIALHSFDLVDNQKVISSLIELIFVA